MASHNSKAEEAKNVGHQKAGEAHQATKVFDWHYLFSCFELVFFFEPGFLLCCGFREC
jgi:hypothetical protein